MKKIGCILLAAGAGARFGGGKLAALLDGLPVIEYILGGIRDADFSCRVIVAANEAMLDTARRYGLGGVVNSIPDLGVSRSIRIGLELMTETDACMFCVADQPLLRQETLDGMLDAYEPGTVLVASHKGQSGNPVIYPASLYSELSSLFGEESGKTVACRHENLLRLFHVNDASQLADIDTREDLIAMQALLSPPDA
jgi:CTP:molybdopterin cytidylyltransferase MocA